MPKTKTDKPDFNKLQKELDEIHNWFQNEDQPDPAKALDKYRRSVEIVKTMKAYLAEVKNEFNDISKELDDEA